MKHRRGGDPRTPGPFRDLTVQEGCIGQALGEVLWDPRSRNAEQLDVRQMQASSVGPRLA